MSDIPKQLHRFAQSIKKSGEIWGLKGVNGWAVCDSIEFEETDVFPFFCTQADANELCTSDWQHYTPTSIDLSQFLNDWLPGMHEDNVMFGLNWNNEMEGPEIEPAEVASALA